MASRRRRGNARQRLQKALKIQRTLEYELQQLNQGEQQENSCKSIIKHVEQSGSDPMLATAEVNPFKAAQNTGCDCSVM
eukprot:UN03347